MAALEIFPEANMPAVEVGDEELASLKRRRQDLVNEAMKLKEEFKNWEMTEIKTVGKTEKDFLPSSKEFEELLTCDVQRLVDQRHRKYVAFSGFITGVNLTRVDKKWISDKKYLYAAGVKSKALEFGLKVIVDVENGSDDESQVLDFSCDFFNIRECYYIEISPWVKRFTNAKDLSNLFSAVADYTEHSVTRMKILKKLSDMSVVTSEERTEEDGGIVMLLHAKDDPDFVYFEIQWALKWVESLWRIDNCFVIQPISAGDEFLKTKNELLLNFCKCRIEKNDLENMWNELSSAVQLDVAAQSSVGSNLS